MKALILRIGLASIVCSSLGCAMCCGPYDYDYPSIGGKHQRSDQTYGRVGSIFSDPMASPTGGDADSNLKAPEPRSRRDRTEESDEADQLRDRIKQELDDKQSPDESKENPKTTEAFRRIQRPQFTPEWR